MKGSYVLRGLAFVLATITTLNLHAQTGGFAVTERGPDWKVLQKTTVEHGTNRVHRYTELATGMNYTNASGQLVESKEQITILPGGGAAAVQGRHKVYFPADLYNGVIEVVTPDGRHLKSRPIGVSYDDGSNTVWIATLKHSVGYLTSSNQVTYRDAFNGFKADIVANYRRGGFECDLVFRQQPPTPDAYSLDPASSTLQLVTEFFNTADPQEIAAASDDWFGLQDSTLKFGKLTMTHGKAFAFKGTNASLSTLNSPALNPSVPVYKSWIHSAGRTFLIETVPLLDIAEDLDALPLTAQNQKPEKGNLKPESKTRLALSRRSETKADASGFKTFPPSHETTADTNQIQLASIDLNKEPGVVLDYNTIDSDQTDFTFQAGTTYYVSGYVNLSGTTTFEGGAVLKFNDNDWGGSLNLDASSTVVCSPASEHPTIFTSFNDDSVGQAISGSSGNPSIYDLSGFFNFNCPSVVLSNMCFNYVSWGIQITGDIDLWNCRFVSVDIAVSAHGDYNENGDYYGGHVRLHNVLFQEIYDDAPVEAGSGTVAENVTLDGFFTIGGVTSQTNCLIVEESSQHNGIPFVPGGDVYVSVNGGSWVYSSAPVFQTAANAHYYLAPGSPYRNVGTTAMDTALLAELQTMTTYAPQDGGMPDTNAPDLGYHYPVNEDSDHDGLTDWWEWHWFGNYNHTGTELDANGIALATDYANNLDPNPISFTAHLGNQHFNTTNATGSFLVLGGVASYEAVLVNSENFSSAVWSNYDGTVHLNLGTTDGVYQVWFGLKGYATNAEPEWIGTKVYLDRIAPTVIIISPTNSTTATPYVQLQGCSPESLLRVTFDLSNSVVVVTNQPGILSGRHLDTNLFAYTTNYFQCYDIHLTNGVNAITVHATDLAGNVTVTNLNDTLNYATATNPVVRLTWPQKGLALSGSNFTVRGWVDDPSAIATAQIVNTNGDTNNVYGLVERNGKLWAENVPLASGTNWLTMTVKNSAGLSTVTNITVIQSSMTLTLTSIDGDLWLPTVNVSGYVSDATQAVWINGVKATVNSGGTWLAHNVPVNEGGTASFDMTAYAPDEQQPDGTYGNGGGN